MDLTPRTTTYQVDDNSWLGSSHGIDSAEPVTLDLALFTAAHYENGFIPSGIALAKVSATSLYGPYDDTEGDGRGVFAGHLLGGVHVHAGVTTGKLGGTMATHIARVKENRLPFQAGEPGGGFIDANARADAAGRIRYVTA